MADLDGHKARRSEPDVPIGSEHETLGYRLPNGCYLRRFGRVRIPREQREQIPADHWDKYDLGVEGGTESSGSIVIVRRPGGVR